MDVSHPIRAVVPSAHGPVLVVLALAGTPLTGRATAALTAPRISQKRVSTILDSLATQGLVTVAEAGSSKLYQLNREHVAAEAVEILATLRERLWQRMSAQVSGWTHQPDAVVVYGSTARGDGDEASDVDILLVRPQRVDEADPAWLRDVDELAQRVHGWTGNPVEILERTPSELDTMAATGERLLHEIRRDGRFLLGRRGMVPAPRDIP